MAENIQSKINKQNSKSQSGILDWIGTFFEGPTEFHKRKKKQAKEEAKKIIAQANKNKKKVSLASLKKDIKGAVPLTGRDFEKPLTSKKKPKDIGDAEDSIRKNRKKRKTSNDGKVSPKLVGAMSPKAKPSQVSAGPGEISNDQYPQRSERSRERLRNVKGKDVISKSAGSKKDSVGKEIARALLGPQKKSKIGKLTADSTDRGMSKFMGTDKEIAEQEMDEEMNFRKGGMPSKKTYGMRAGGFTKRGGMYKKGY